LTLAIQAQRQQISYIEETKNWYYVYDEKGKKICGLSRSSVGELKGWGSDFFWRRGKCPWIAPMQPNQISWRNGT